MGPRLGGDQDELWQQFGRSDEVTGLLLGLGLLVAVYLVLLIGVVFQPRGGVKPFAVLVLSVVFAVALLSLPGSG